MSSNGQRSPQQEAEQAQLSLLRHQYRAARAIRQLVDTELARVGQERGGAVPPAT
jgi:hypothetical protein